MTCAIFLDDDPRLCNIFSMQDPSSQKISCMVKHVKIENQKKSQIVDNERVDNEIDPLNHNDCQNITKKKRSRFAICS